LGANSDLWFCKGGNAAQGIPMTPATVIVTNIYDSGDCTFHVRPLIRQHKLEGQSPLDRQGAGGDLPDGRGRRQIQAALWR